MHYIIYESFTSFLGHYIPIKTFLLSNQPRFFGSITC